ncbi:MAG: hypothetical protein FWF97_01590 [Alphaproteobacteria bacterium]|nr:hypothetical protein [Alphaproteobacteria bacterium]
MKPGKRICILGGTCSGKSTLAIQLGDALGYKVLHMDWIYYIPNNNWVRALPEITGKKHDEFIRQNSWIIDGTYREYLPKRLAAADTVIILRAPKIIRLWRFFIRGRNNGKNRVDKSVGGEFKDFTWAHVWWILFKERHRKKDYIFLKDYPHLKIIILHSFREMESFLESVQTAA